MSFSVDLWNGFDIIKTQIFSVQKKMKVISKAISSYLAIDATYNKNLENLYKEFKEINNSEYMMDKSYIKILDIFEYENQNRKIISSYMNTLIMEPLNEYLRQPNILLNKCFSDNIYNEESFKRSLNLLKEKQINYWKDCKELSVLLAQNEMDEMNNTTGKIAKTRLSRINEKFLKLNASKQEYIDTINESNKEREKYNKKTEEILNTLEQIYTTMLSKLKEALTNFASQRNEFLQKIYNKEKMEYETIHVKVDPKKELFQFVSNNATKEFPMIKFEFCPLKYSVLNQNIKNKCSKFPDTAFPKIYKSVKNFFEENKIFKEEALFRLNRRNTDFRSIFSKKSLRTDMEINKNDQKQNKEFIDKYITGLFMNKTQEKKENEVKKDNDKTDENAVNNNNTKDNIEANKNNIGKDMKESIQPKEKDNQKENNKEDKSLQGSSEETKEKIIKNEPHNEKPEPNETIKDDKIIIDNNTSQKSENIIKKESGEILKPKLETEEDVIQNYFYSEHPNYLNNAETLIKRLSYLRSKGHFLIGEKAYNEILSLFFIILNQEQKNYYILKNVLILSQTFYKIKDNKKVYLQQGMKGSKVFMNPETWHRVINYSMNLSCSSMDLTQTKEDMIKKINKEANVIIMAYLCDIKQYTNDDEVFDEVKNYYVKVYNLDEEMINKEVENYMNSLNKNESTEQEKHMKIEEKIKNDDDEVENDNDNNENNTNIDETINFIKQRSYSTPINIKENNKALKENKKNEIVSIKENIKEENESEENNILSEIKDDKNQKDKNKIEINNSDKVENSENKNQIINNNINIIKIEAKEVIIVENNSKNNINIEQITSLKKDNKDIIKDNNIQKDDKKEINETNNNQNQEKK